MLCSDKKALAAYTAHVHVVCPVISLFRLIHGHVYHSLEWHFSNRGTKGQLRKIRTVSLLKEGVKLNYQSRPWKTVVDLLSK